MAEGELDGEEVPGAFLPADYKKDEDDRWWTFNNELVTPPPSSPLFPYTACAPTFLVCHADYPYYDED